MCRLCTFSTSNQRLQVWTWLEAKKGGLVRGEGGLWKFSSRGNWARTYDLLPLMGYARTKGKWEQEKEEEKEWQLREGDKKEERRRRGGRGGEGIERRMNGENEEDDRRRGSFNRTGPLRSSKLGRGTSKVRPLAVQCCPCFGSEQNRALLPTRCARKPLWEAPPPSSKMELCQSLHKTRGKPFALPWIFAFARL